MDYHICTCESQLLINVINKYSLIQLISHSRFKVYGSGTNQLQENKSRTFQDRGKDILEIRGTNRSKDEYINN